jgi:uncharacterized protein
MKRMGMPIAGMVAVSVLCLGSTALQSGGKKSDDEVKVTARAEKIGADGRQKVTITLAVNKGWHIYANPVDNETLNSARTLVSIKSKAAFEDIKVKYPAGKPSKDASGEKYKIYQDTVHIQADLKRAPGDDSPLEIRVRFMACNDERGVCLLPATVQLTAK